METHKSTGRSQRTEENNIDRTISGPWDSQKAISVQPRRRSARLIAISKPSAKSQNDEEKRIQDDDGEVDENLEEKMDVSPLSCGLKEDSANAAQNGNAENNPNPMGQKTGDFRRENRQKSRNMQPALSKRRKNAISIPKMTKELHTDDVSQPSSSGTQASGTFLFSSPSTSSSSNGTFRSPNDIYPSSSTHQQLFFQRPRPSTGNETTLNKEDEDAKPMLSDSSDDVGEDEWESVAHTTDGDKQRREGDSVQVHLEGEAAEKFKNEMNPLRAKSEKEAQERAKWEHWMRLEVERRRKELQEDLHRIHFLAHIAHLRFLVSSLTKNRAQLLDSLNSLLDGPSSAAVPMTSTQMQKLLAEVFRPKFLSQEDKPPRYWCNSESSVLAHLLSLIQQKGFNTDREIALLFFAYCAFLLELPTRICLAFNPMARLLKIPKYLGFEKARGRKTVIKTEANSKNKKKTTSTNKKQRLAQKAGKGEAQGESDVNSSASSSSSDEEEEDDEREIAKMSRRKRRTTTTKATTQNSSSNNNRTKKKKEKSSNAGNGNGTMEREKEEEGKEDVKKREKHLDMGDVEKEQQQNHSSNHSAAYWNEYWDELEQRWICVDAFFTDFDAPERIEQRAGFKFLYVLAIDNEMGVREVAAKYSSTFLALETRKLRTDADWIAHTMEYPILRSNEPRVRLENSAILELLKSKPLPAKLNEFKNHPLYALQKDLLKFEAIYPADTAPVGRIRNHDIYPRSAVHKLEGSLNWIKESRSIKEGELPYKVVGARPKVNIPKEKRQPLTLDLFGFWQTEPYKPPRVEDGLIPRNQFGNIYMYKAEMLPQGCVHLRLPGIFQLARRFDLEAVPAVVGWEYSGGLNHPILDGCVVLQKDEEVLRSAWQEMSQNKAANQAKKSEERVLKNWRRLIRGKRLLEQMRERFK